MMKSQFKRALISWPVFTGGGTAAVGLAVLLTWVNLSAWLNSRQPVPSTDGKYFAYFNSTRAFPTAGQNDYDLIVSESDGHEVAHFSVGVGAISWSNAGDLAVVDVKRNQAALIAKSEERFLPVRNLVLARGTEPRWSTDGTKIAYVQPEMDGGGISIYDFLQTRSSAVPFPAGFHLDAPLPLFWSPGGGTLFFLNGEKHSVVLERVEIQSGKLQPLAAGSGSWRASFSSRPRLSPDGTKIYLPPPLNSVIEAQTGRTIWTLPAASRVGWSLWSAEGHRLYYQRGGSLGAVVAHDFVNSTDQVILIHAEPDGFISVDGESYFHRLPQPWQAAYADSFGDWLRLQWGWRQHLIASDSEVPLGRALLQPWAETRDGLILMFRDDYARVRYGLYDSQSQTLAEFVFPTGWQDLFQQARAQAFILVSVLLYGALAFLVYLKRTGSPPARAFFILSLTLMVLFASLTARDTLASIEVAPTPWNTADLTLMAAGWRAANIRLALLGGARAWFAIALALLPPVLLHFTLAIVEGNQFLTDRKWLKSVLYGAACLPFIRLILEFSGAGPTNILLSYLPGLFYIAGTVVVIAALFVLLGNYRKPREHRAVHQFRWAIFALAVPLAGLAGRWVLHIFLRGLK
jgi:hypothetical protein